MKLYSFSVDAIGAVTPSQGSTTIISGQETGSPRKIFLTITATWIDTADNLPLTARPWDGPDWTAPPVIDNYEINLDKFTGWTPTLDNCKNLSIESDYYYTNWAFSSPFEYRLITIK